MLTLAYKMHTRHRQWRRKSAKMKNFVSLLDVFFYFFSHLISGTTTVIFVSNLFGTYFSCFICSTINRATQRKNDRLLNSWSLFVQHFFRFKIKKPAELLPFGHCTIDMDQHCLVMFSRFASHKSLYGKYKRNNTLHTIHAHQIVK